jgi:prophage regulatory protein
MSLEHAPRRQKKTGSAKPHVIISEKVDAPPVPVRLLRLPAVLARVGMSEGTWLAAVKAGLAPKPIPVMPGGRAVAWIESEITAWIEERIKAERA